jgi:glycerophosphoryl diester phosphodiesterase
VGLHHAQVQSHTKAAARQAGNQHAVLTVNQPAPLRRFIEQTVGIVITERPALAKALERE